MSKANYKKATQEALRLLTSADDSDIHDIIVVSKKLVAQLQTLFLLRFLTLDEIAERCKVNEKTIRFWRDADQCPNLNNAIKLETLYESLRQAGDAKKRTRKNARV